VRLRSFNTRIHKVDAMVCYKNIDWCHQFGCKHYLVFPGEKMCGCLWRLYPFEKDLFYCEWSRSTSHTRAGMELPTSQIAIGWSFYYLAKIFSVWLFSFQLKMHWKEIFG
jgi:hypothetical protein